MLLLETEKISSSCLDDVNSCPITRVIFNGPRVTFLPIIKTREHRGRTYFQIAVSREGRYFKKAWLMSEPNTNLYTLTTKSQLDSYYNEIIVKSEPKAPQSLINNLCGHTKESNRLFFNLKVTNEIYGLLVVD
jgi:hypothetical protein